MAASGDEASIIVGDELQGAAETIRKLMPGSIKLESTQETGLRLRGEDRSDLGVMEV